MRGWRCVPLTDFPCPALPRMAEWGATEVNMAEKYKVVRDLFAWRVQIVGGQYNSDYVASFCRAKTDARMPGGSCPNAEREARNLCRRLNAAAKKKKGKR